MGLAAGGESLARNLVSSSAALRRSSSVATEGMVEGEQHEAALRRSDSLRPLFGGATRAVRRDSRRRAPGPSRPEAGTSAVAPFARERPNPAPGATRARRGRSRTRTISPAAEWLLSNFHLVEEQIREIRDLLRVLRELPKLAAGTLKALPVAAWPGRRSATADDVDPAPPLRPAPTSESGR